MHSPVRLEANGGQFGIGGGMARLLLMWLAPPGLPAWNWTELA